MSDLGRRTENLIAEREPSEEAMKAAEDAYFDVESETLLRAGLRQALRAAYKVDQGRLRESGK